MTRSLSPRNRKRPKSPTKPSRRCLAGCAPSGARADANPAHGRPRFSLLLPVLALLLGALGLVPAGPAAAQTYVSTTLTVDEGDAGPTQRRGCSDQSYLDACSTGLGEDSFGLDGQTYTIVALSTRT